MAGIGLQMGLGEMGAGAGSRARIALLSQRRIMAISP